MKRGEYARLSVSVVVPVHNERDNLRGLHHEIRTALNGLHCPWEIIVVNDGSDDGSGARLDEIARSDGRLRVLHLSRRIGQSGALLAGFDSVRGDVVVTMDGDLQNDPADIPRLLQALPASGMVVGRRVQRADTWLRRVASRWANGARNLVTGDGVADIGCSLKAFTRDALRRLPPVRGTHRFLPTLVRLAGHEVREIPVNHRARRAGHSKYGILDRLFVGMGDLAMMGWMRFRSVSYRVARSSGEGLGAEQAEDTTLRISRGA